MAVEFDYSLDFIKDIFKGSSLGIQSQIVKALGLPNFESINVENGKNKVVNTFAKYFDLGKAKNFEVPTGQMEIQLKLQELQKLLKDASEENLQTIKKVSDEAIVLILTFLKRYIDVYKLKLDTKATKEQGIRNSYKKLLESETIAPLYESFTTIRSILREPRSNPLELSESQQNEIYNFLSKTNIDELKRIVLSKLIIEKILTFVQTYQSKLDIKLTPELLILQLTLKYFSYLGVLANINLYISENRIEELKTINSFTNVKQRLYRNVTRRNKSRRAVEEAAEATEAAGGNN